MTDLVPFTQEFAVLGEGAQEFLDVLEENTGSREFNLASVPTYTFPGSGDDRWRWVDSAGETHRLDTIIGVVLGQRVQRTFYISDYTDGGVPPDCQSQEGRQGQPLTEEGSGRLLNVLTDVNGNDLTFGGACASCPLNQWDSAALVGKKGTGKACREQRMLIVQRPEDPTPMRVRIPPTALRTWQAFGETLTQSGLRRLSQSVVELGLEVPKGKNLAELQVSLLATIPEGTSARLKELVPDAKRPQLAAPVIEHDDAGEDDAPPF